MDQYVESTTMAAVAGTKRSHERDGAGEVQPDVFLEKRCKYYWDVEDEVELPAVGTKRRYERDEEKSDVIFQKRFKPSQAPADLIFWEDPSQAPADLQRWGSSLAQMAALDIDTVRFFQEMHAWKVARGYV